MFDQIQPMIGISKTLHFLFLISAVALQVKSTTAVMNESYFVHQVLLKDYDPIVRPVLSPADPINVTISLGLKAFVALDMRLQTFLCFGWFKVFWFDDFLTWNPQAYSNLTSVYLPMNKVWRPELVIFNTVGDINALNDQTTNVAVRHDGRILWYPGGMFQTYCAVDITYFPFDIQSCSVDVITWALPMNVLNGTFGDPVWDLIDLLDRHPEWELLDTDHKYQLRPTQYWVLRFIFRLKRKPLFYIVNIILPMMLLSLLNCLVFLLPTDSGEKMTVSVTSFLSLAVFISFINEALPRNSDSLCFFSVYVMFQMFLSLCSTTICAVTVNIASNDRLPGCLPSKSSALSLKKGDNHSHNHASDLSNIEAECSVFSELTSLRFLTGARKHNVEDNDDDPMDTKLASSKKTETGQQSHMTDNDAGHWKRKMELLERVFLGVMICANLVSCLVFIILMNGAG